MKEGCIYNKMFRKQFYFKTLKVKSSFGNNPITVNKKEKREINTNDGDEGDLVQLDRRPGDEILCLHVEKEKNFEWDTPN